MRKFLIMIVFLALAVILLPWLHPRAEAAVIGPDQARIAKFWIGQKYYEVDGKRYDMDVAPYVKNDRTMMPARFLAYSLGIPEDSVKWNEQAQTVNISRGPDNIFMTVGKNNFWINGYPNLPSKFDVPPEVVPPGRTMIPYRAVAQALGALVFWDDASQCVTVETWRDVPQPTSLTVKKVMVYKNQNTADVVGVDGSENQVQADYPAMVTDPRDGGYTLDAIEWFKLWGVPDENILYDSVRGGLAVRGADSKFKMTEEDIQGKYASGYIYFYIGERLAWNNYFINTKVDSTSTDNTIVNGRFNSDWPVINSTMYLFGKTAKDGKVTNDTSTAWLELNQ